MCSGRAFTKCVSKADITINAYDVTNSEEADMVEGQGGVACGIACMAIDSTAKHVPFRKDHDKRRSSLGK